MNEVPAHDSDTTIEEEPMTSTPGATLRRLMMAAGARREPLVVPGVFDCMSALLARDAGFEALYVGSYATAFHRLGLPDLGYVGRSDMTDNIRRIVDAVDVPLISDGEAGFGNPIHAAETVRAFERAGAAGLHLEDHEFGKHLTGHPVLSSPEKAADRIRAAVDARSDDDFVVIARTDAQLSKELGVDEVIERLGQYAEAGADLVFAPGLQPDQYARVSASVPAPLLNDPVSLPGGPTLTEMWEKGVRVALYGTISTSVAFAAVRDGLNELHRNGLSSDLRARLTQMPELDRFLGVPSIHAAAERYHALDSNQLAIGFW